MFAFKPGIEFILASASPRRRQLLGDLGLAFDVAVPDCDETQLENESAEHMVRRLALDKAGKIAAVSPRTWVLGADTTVVVDGITLGKPADVTEAARMLKSIQGRVHQVYGAFALQNLESGQSISEVKVSHVTMAPLTDGQIAAYIRSGEPMDKAGSYAIQGIGAALVQEVSGSYTNVVGLDICTLIQTLQKLGLLQ